MELTHIDIAIHSRRTGEVGGYPESKGKLYPVFKRETQ